MPEALALLFIAAVGTGLFVFARFGVRPPTPAEERTQLRRQIDWIEERLRHADEKHWDAHMKSRLDAQLTGARQKLVEVEARIGQLEVRIAPS